MSDPTPRDAYRPHPAPPTVDRDPVTISYAARLLPLDEALDLSLLPPAPSSWTITHGLGKPAGGTYTEVRFADDALLDTVNNPAPGLPRPEHVLDEVVRRVARDLYGTAWAFHYRPDQYADAIRRHGLRRREVVVVESVEVYR
jgi:hypothetical protein